MGIHTYLLWADLDWPRQKSFAKPNPQTITLSLASLPTAKAEPVQKITPQPSKKPVEPRQILKSIPKPPDPVFEPIPEPDVRPSLSKEKPPERVLPEEELAPASSLDISPAQEAESTSAIKTLSNSEPLTTATLFQTTDAGPNLSSAVPIREARPRYRENPSPPYPLLARRKGYQGNVILDVLIDINGRVADMKVFSSSGFAVLDTAARTTVEKWRFDPGVKGNKKIEMWVKVPIRFQLK